VAILKHSTALIMPILTPHTFHISSHISLYLIFFQFLFNHAAEWSNRANIKEIISTHFSPHLSRFKMTFEMVINNKLRERKK
jgi:phosphoribosyl 1,2-cyclic phosphodiesterase